MLRITWSTSGECGKLNYNNYGDDSSQSQSSTWGILLGLRGKVVKIMCQGGKPDTGKLHSSYIRMNACGFSENGLISRPIHWCNRYQWRKPTASGRPRPLITLGPVIIFSPPSTKIQSDTGSGQWL